MVCGEAEKVTCTPTNNGKSTYTENCPSGQTGQITYTWNTVTCKYDETSNTCRTVQTCSDATYKANHKKECCPSAPKTDTVCYKYEWVWSGHFGANDNLCIDRDDYFDGCAGSECSSPEDTCQIESCSGGITDTDYYQCELSKNGW